VEGERKQTNQGAGAQGNRRDASPRVARRCAREGGITEMPTLGLLPKGRENGGWNESTVPLRLVLTLKRYRAFRAELMVATVRDFQVTRSSQ
jgi:hypothetical protein